jgi:hypothetical protein
MIDQHPITPPPELVTEWWSKCTATSDNLIGQLATQAARWGADQELEACCKLLKADGYKGKAIDLRAARRPKPPSLKEQALEALFVINDPLGSLPPRHYDTIRRALEALPND